MPVIPTPFWTLLTPVIKAKRVRKTNMSKRRQASKRKQHKKQPLPQAKQWVAALAALGNEQWAEAIERCQKFMQGMNNPEERLPIYYNLATCYLESGLYDEALAVWDKIAAVTGENADVLFGRGGAYGCAGRPTEAIQTFTQFRQLAPARAEQLGIEGMIADLQAELKGEQPSGSFLYEYIEARIGMNLELGDYDLMKDKAGRLISVLNERPEGHFALGLALLRQKQPVDALTGFLAAHTLEPTYIPTLYNIGYSYFEAGQLEEAMIWLERTLEQDKSYAPAWQIMGQIQQRQGQTEKAIESWQQALNSQPDYEPAQEALFEVGAGPQPEEPTSPVTAQLQRYVPLVKERMRRPRIYRNGRVTLTFDPNVGFTLEDAENVRNGTVYAGGPFRVAQMDATDIRHFIGVLKLLARQANKYTCRDMAILAYYPNQPSFSYQAQLEDGELVTNGNGRLFSDQTPSHLKVRVDSDLESPYGTPFSGYFIYLAQGGRPGLAVLTLGLSTPTG
jgi:tetratricopeptide (TPR) repeat protein